MLHGHATSCIQMRARSSVLEALLLSVMVVWAATSPGETEVLLFLPITTEHLELVLMLPKQLSVGICFLFQTTQHRSRKKGCFSSPSPWSALSHWAFLVLSIGLEAPFPGVQHGGTIFNEFMILCVC